MRTNRRRTSSPRKSAPRVVNGRVARKNNWRRTNSRYYLDLRVSIERNRPMKGRHLLRKVDVCRFLRLVPDWDRYSERLERVLLDCSSDSGLGWYGYTGVIAVHAFPRDLTLTFDPSYFYMDLAFMKKVGVGFCENDAGEIVCKFTRSQARAYQLLRVLVHEFGHHVDYVTNRRRACTRGERFAEAFTDKIEAEIWPSYVQTFGDPQRQQ